MKTKILGLLAVGLLAGPMQAFAVPMQYTINFTGAGILPTGGSFTYDSDVPIFSNFLVTWNGYTFDLTARANTPQTAGDSCGFGAGAANAFAFISNPLSSKCPVTRWSSAVDERTMLANFRFTTISSTGGANSFTIFSVVSADRALGRSDLGVWTTSPVRTPEPGTVALLALGLAGIGVTRRRARQTAKV